MPAISRWSAGLDPALLLWARRTLPPLVVFLFARVRLSRSAVFAGADPSAPGAWARWDSAHYLSIAERGYEFFSCARIPGYDPNLHCGNTAWLPGYSLLIRALTVLHLDPVTAGTLIAGGFALATLVVLWNGFLDAELSVASLLTLLLAGFFPGHVYYHAVFPLSVCTFFHVVAMRAYVTRHFAWAGVAAAFAAFTYSSGMFIAAVFGLHLLIVERRRPWPQQIRQWLLTSGITLLGFAAFLLMLQLGVGTWKAYFLVQAKYNYDPTWPWTAIVNRAREARFVGPKFPNVQTVYVAGLATLLIAAAVRTERRAVDGALALFVLVYWWIPLAMGGSLSLYRADAMLLTAVPLAKKLPVPVLLVLVVVALMIAGKMDVYFFRNALA